MAEQAAWVAHRRRKWRAHRGLRQQIHAQLDLVFPGLAGCFANVLDSRSGWVILRDIPDPGRVVRLGGDGLRRYVKRRGVRMTRTKAAQVLDAARVVLALPAPERATLEQILSADLALLAAIDDQILAAVAELTRLLPDTPAGVLTTLPGIGVVRAFELRCRARRPGPVPQCRFRVRGRGTDSGPPRVIPHALARTRDHQGGIDRVTPRHHRTGPRLGHHHPEFLAYRQRLRAVGKAPGIAAVALGHRAHRLAFAMVRDRHSFDPHRWEESTQQGRSVMAKTSRSTNRRNRPHLTIAPPVAVVNRPGGTRRTGPERRRSRFDRDCGCRSH